MANTISISPGTGTDFDDLTPTLQLNWTSDAGAIVVRLGIKRGGSTVYNFSPTQYTGAEAANFGAYATVPSGYLQQYEVYTARAELWTVSGGFETLRVTDEITFTARGNQPPAVSVLSPSSGESVPTLEPEVTLQFSDPNTQTLIGEFDSARVVWKDGASFQTLYDTGQVSATTAEKSSRTKTFSYADAIADGAPELESGDSVRVEAYAWDGAGARSALATRTFSVAVAPEAPTITSPAADAVVDTLTFLIAGTYHAGSAGAEGEWRYQLQRGASNVYITGWISGPVASGQIYGTDNSGDLPATPPTLLWGTGYRLRLQSRDEDGNESPWSAYRNLRTNAAPLAPTITAPLGNPVSSSGTVTVQHVHNDPDDDVQTGRRYKAWESESGDPITGYNPKEILDSGTTHLLDTGLDGDTPTEVLIAVSTRGTTGPGWGPYSAPVPITVADAPTITITSPLDGATLDSLQIHTAWAFDSPSGDQTSARVVMRDLAGVIRYDSEQMATTETEFLIPGHLHAIPPGSYDIQIYGWDEVGVMGTSPTVRVHIAFTPPPPITGLQAFPIGEEV